MYDFSGIIYRIWGVAGIMLFSGVILILFEKPWKKGLKSKDGKFGLFVVAFAIGLILFYISRISFPKVSSYTGEYIDYSRASNTAPPLPLTCEYVFWNGEGKKYGFYLDVFSNDKVFPGELEQGKKYTVYFDNFTKVIVRIDAVE